MSGCEADIHCYIEMRCVGQHINEIPCARYMVYNLDQWFSNCVLRHCAARDSHVCRKFLFVHKMS
jgi:hypothetical protein